MVKIKVEKKMDLLELLQWAWDKDIDTVFYSNSTGGSVAIENNQIMIEHEINKNETFNVEEEITEETKIPFLLEIGANYDETIFSNLTSNACIADEKDSQSIAFYMADPDSTLTLLWTREGGMVENE